MPPQDDTNQDSARSYAERWAAESLFIGEAAEEQVPVVDQWYQAYTPFREEQELEEMYSPEAEEEDYSAQLEDEEPDEEAYEQTNETSELYPERYSAELQDGEPDEEAYEQIDEASELYPEQLAGEDEYPVTQSAGPGRLPQEHFESLVGEAKGLLDDMASDLRRYHVAAMSEAEMEALLDQYQSVGTRLPQGFEYLLDDVRDTAKRLFKDAVNLTEFQTRQQAVIPCPPRPQARGVPFRGARRLRDPICQQSVCVSVYLNVRTQQRGIFAYNLSHFDADVTLNFTGGTNVIGSHPLPLRVLLPPQSPEVYLMHFDVQQPGTPVAIGTMTFRVQFGDPCAQHDGTLYALPFPATERYRCTQGFNDTTRTHHGPKRYSVDFAMPEGSVVAAARGGVVALVTRHPRFGNSIEIRHSDGTYGLYGHLKNGGFKVKSGDSVRKGQEIALSGNTGISTGPHLHFDVEVADGLGGWQTVPWKFKDILGPFEPKSGVTYPVADVGDFPEVRRHRAKA